MTELTARDPRSRSVLSMRALAWFALGPLLALALGCSGDHLTRAQPIAPDSLYWAMAVNHRAVTLSLQSPYDTLTLAVAARNSRGEPLTGLGTPQYKSLDLDHVQVTPEGVLRAMQLTTEGEPIAVVASLTANNLTYTDTVLVRVVADTLPKLASLSIHPVPPDSAKTGVNVDGSFGSPLSVRATDSDGAPIADPLISIRSSDPSTADILYLLGKPRVQGSQLGTVTLIASATVFGVVKADTLPYRIGWPVQALVYARRVATPSGDSVVVFDPSDKRVGTGAIVIWEVRDPSDTVDGIFAESDIPNIMPADTSAFIWTLHPFAQFFGSTSAFRSVICSIGPSDCDGGGNILLLPERPKAFRVFSSPGTYEYHSSRSGASGRIIVVDERP